MTDDARDGSPADDALEARLHELHAHLEATAEVPIDPRTNRWLGEADAVARDAATSGLDEATAKRRVRQVRRLLDEADATGHEAADAHLEAARTLCERILAE